MEMEEHVGQYWDRFITKISYDGFPESAVELKQVSNSLGIFFRALGGDGALSITASTATYHGARRSWLHRIAGTGRKVELAWRDDERLYLPQKLDAYPDPKLNRELYFWLAALAGTPVELNGGWLLSNQQRTLATLEQFPGLRGRYKRLVDGLLLVRPPLDKLSAGEVEQEQAIQAALKDPGSVAELPETSFAPYPVPLWLHPSPPRSDLSVERQAAEQQNNKSDAASKEAEEKRRQAKRDDAPDSAGAPMTVRHETSFMTFAEYVKLDRAAEEDEDLEQAENIADDLDNMSVTQDEQTTVSSIKFDLDLPSVAEDDIPLSEGVLLPEWDFKKQCMQEDFARVIPMMSRHAEPRELPDHLKKVARRLKRQFEAISARPTWVRGQYEGDRLDIDAYLDHCGDKASGSDCGDPKLFCQKRPLVRDLACLLLADLSLSTDAWVNNDRQVIDVIRDSLYLFAESLSGSGDRFAIHGFSSKKRHHVRMNQIKNFDENYGAEIRGRIDDVKPGFYTRMGTAIRQATEILKEQPGEKKLLLLLTDGKPNDLDRYEGRYGIEDTRMAVIEARQEGLVPFCITIDKEANQYLPYLFGQKGFTLIRKADQLPQRLPQLYMHLTDKLSG
ncbi:MAG: VWA domain-containing protein [Motiliproteus sp.]|nr:VWA domain-containing protein [Motiliproteus sp.]MCW9051322.1 VWA domain-containing protein [Motiliproteus sp.]